MNHTTRFCRDKVHANAVYFGIPMGLHAILVAVAVYSFPCPMLYAEEPTFNSIDYSKPAKYLVIADSLGNHDDVAKQGNALKRASDRKTLQSILNWMQTHLKLDADRAYKWRNFDTVMSEQCYSSCADQAIVAGALLKATGIPTVWVKTMDVDWIWDFKKKRPFDSWSGHVFLEIYLDGKWVLLDPGSSKIYTEYSTGSRILPGNRFAYHKGNDPQQMVMSLQWEEWKRQTASYFSDLDDSLLPVDTKSAQSVQRRCFIVANSPYHQLFGELARRHGASVGPSFNNTYEKYLPMAHGNIVLVETHDGTPIVDLKILRNHFPFVPAGKQRGKVVDGETAIIFVDVAKFAKQISNTVGN